MTPQWPVLHEMDHGFDDECPLCLEERATADAKLERALVEALHEVDDDLHFIRRDARNLPVLAARILAAIRSRS